MLPGRGVILGTDPSYYFAGFPSFSTSSVIPPMAAFRLLFRLRNMVDSITGASPRQLARTAGALYLINIVFGAFSLGVVPAMLVVPGMAATAHNIAAHELLYRLGLAAHVVVTVTNIPMAVIFYDLLKVVNRRVALLDVFFTLIATSMEAGGILSQFTPLVLAGGSYAHALPPAQRSALAYLPGDLSATGYSLYGIFYGFDALCIAYLVLKSTFLPRALGVLMAVDGLASYLAYGFTDLLAPGLAAHLAPWIQLPTIIGEGSLCLWLLIAGVDTRRWTQQASLPREGRLGQECIENVSKISKSHQPQ
jgi:hypothetical protein